MKRLYHGHLHPKLEVPGLTGNRTRASTVGGEHSRKEPSEQLVISCSEHLHMSERLVENARDSTISKKEFFDVLNSLFRN
jgi:hypothetical protein